jgi:hypothetical protein
MKDLFDFDILKVASDAQRRATAPDASHLHQGGRGRDA